MPSLFIKDANDKSTWPNGATPLFTVDGLSATESDTAFDAVMRSNASSDVVVYLGPGVFLTRGACGNSFPQDYQPGWRLQNGSQLIGSGRTTLRLAASNFACGGLVIGANEFNPNGTRTNNSGIVVSDLDVDCNSPEIAKEDPNAPWQIQGVQLFGSSCRIERVNVRNATAMGPNKTAPKVESFVLCINSCGYSVGNLIDRCSVTDFFNPYGTACCSAISLNSFVEGLISGTISNCDVTLNGERGWGFGGEFAYNLARADRVTLANCRSRGAQRGFNNDSLPNANLEVSSNYFDVPPGICFGFILLKPNEMSKFIGNTVILRGSGGSAFLVDRAGEDGNCLLFEGNAVVAAGSWPGQAVSFNFHDNLDPLKAPSKVHLRSNTVAYLPHAKIQALVLPECGCMEGNLVNGVEWLWPVAQLNAGWKFPV